MACERCKLPYPDDMLSEVVASAPKMPTIKTNLCGICALAMTNQLHGAKRRRFIGTIAEQMRQRAISWRKKHRYSTSPGFINNASTA